MKDMKAIARGVLFVVVTLLLSLVLVFVSSRFASKYSVGTPGDFVANHVLKTPTGPGFSLGERAIIVLSTDIACWFVVLSGLYWVIRRIARRKMRGNRNETPEKIGRS